LAICSAAFGSRRSSYTSAVFTITRGSTGVIWRSSIFNPRSLDGGTSAAAQRSRGAVPRISSARSKEEALRTVSSDSCCTTADSGRPARRACSASRASGSTAAFRL
jgi:hypothetical protein